ncbi:hypothetical protein BDR07DRAFT_724932 [Suillus spraguei]|nr:hypothetical protein BDR07DRAFT_724932 [Suillus spraguei]
MVMSYHTYKYKLTGHTFKRPECERHSKCCSILAKNLIHFSKRRITSTVPWGKDTLEDILLIGGSWRLYLTSYMIIHSAFRLHLSMTRLADWETVHDTDLYI